MQRWHKRHTPALTFLLSLLLWSASADADSGSASVEATAQPLTPFKAYYHAEFDLGINLNGQATRQLEPLGNGQWQLSMHASAMVASIKESSRFELQSEQQLRPQHYNYQRKVIGKKKQRELTFDWQQQRIASRNNDDTRTINLAPGTLDGISYQIQLWHDIKAGKQSVDYLTANDGRIKTYRFKRLGEETINTPAGSFETVKVARDRGIKSERQTYIWFSKAHDHVIVKLEQIETDSKRYTLLLKRLE